MKFTSEINARAKEIREEAAKRFGGDAKDYNRQEAVKLACEGFEFKIKLDEKYGCRGHLQFGRTPLWYADCHDGGGGMNYKEKVEKIIEKTGWTQKTLALKVGRDGAAITRILKGQEPQVKTLERILDDLYYMLVEKWEKCRPLHEIAQAILNECSYTSNPFLYGDLNVLPSDTRNMREMIPSMRGEYYCIGRGTDISHEESFLFVRYIFKEGGTFFRLRTPEFENEFYIEKSDLEKIAANPDAVINPAEEYSPVQIGAIVRSATRRMK